MTIKVNIYAKLNRSGSTRNSVGYVDFEKILLSRLVHKSCEESLSILVTCYEIIGFLLIKKKPSDELYIYTTIISISTIKFCKSSGIIIFLSDYCTLSVTSQVLKFCLSGLAVF